MSSVLVLGEAAQPTTFGAGALVIGGAYFLVRCRGDGERRPRSRLLARLAALGAGMLWGFTAAVPTKYCIEHGMSPIEYQFLFLCASVFWWTLAAMPQLRKRRIRFSPKDLGITFATAFFGLFTAWVFWLSALQRTEASVLSPLFGLALLFTVLLGAVFLRERLTKKVLIGGGLVLAGVTLVSILAR